MSVLLKFNDKRVLFLMTTSFGKKLILQTKSEREGGGDREKERERERERE